MGPPGNRGPWGPCVLAQTQKSLSKRYQGHLMGPPTDPGPSDIQCRTIFSWHCTLRMWSDHQRRN
ncbi:unnamed protein product [Staurois parvus]|uniref:Uncharacterized protein n=1 Tax=Staurois parvus TaxID=386267 RepID=A0ABN9HFM9_9NEOB|nr:unnamed protein product [Staurois parvus]